MTQTPTEGFGPNGYPAEHPSNAHRLPVPLTSVQAVRAAIAEVRVAVEQGDFERAHSRERDLMIGALEAIASSNAQAGYIAAEALTVTEIDFPRWMA